MSSILDALNKLEQERAQVEEAKDAGVIDPREAAAELVGARGKRNNWPPMAWISFGIVGIGLVVGLSVLITLSILGQTPNAPESTAAESLATVAPEPAAVASAAEPEPAPTTDPEPAPAVIPAAEPEPEPEPEPAPATLPQPEPDEPLSKSSPEPVDNPPSNSSIERSEPAAVSEPVPVDPAPEPETAPEPVAAVESAPEPAEESETDQTPEPEAAPEPVAAVEPVPEPAEEPEMDQTPEPEPEPSQPVQVARQSAQTDPPNASPFAVPAGYDDDSSSQKSDPEPVSGTDIRELPPLTVAVEKRLGLDRIRLNMVSPSTANKPYAYAIINRIKVSVGDRIGTSRARLVAVESFGIAVEAGGSEYFVSF